MIVLYTLYHVSKVDEIDRLTSALLEIEGSDPNRQSKSDRGSLVLSDGRNSLTESAGQHYFEGLS